MSSVHDDNICNDDRRTLGLSHQAFWAKLYGARNARASPSFEVTSVLFGLCRVLDWKDLALKGKLDHVSTYLVQDIGKGRSVSLILLLTLKFVTALFHSYTAVYSLKHFRHTTDRYTIRSVRAVKIGDCRVRSWFNFVDGQRYLQLHER